MASRPAERVLGNKFASAWTRTTNGAAFPMNSLRLFLALLLVAIGGRAATTDLLSTLRPGHPRLLFSDDQLAAALEAAKSDPVRAALHQRIMATAEALLGAPPLRANQGKVLEEQQRIALYQLSTCAMAYRLTGDVRFAERVKQDLRTVCGFADWDPRHDLAIGEMGVAVGIAYDWVYPQLDARLRGAVKKALVENVLTFGERSYLHRPPATVTRGNHNQVCNAGLVCAALAIADEEPDLARRVIAGARESMPYALEAYAPDGGFPEGPGYWTYGTTFSVITFAALESALGSDLGLTASTPGFARSIEYYEAVQGPFGSVFNYADSSEDLQNSPARAWLADRYHAATATRHTRALLAEALSHGKITPFDRTVQALVINRVFALHAVWFPRDPAGDVPDLPLDAHFRGTADIAVFRSAWRDPRALYVGLKAGENGDHHNHLDLGSFVLDADGERWASDLGPEATNGSYDLPGYFDNKARRWTYFRTNNRSHNTVTPSDALQARHVDAPITAFVSTPSRAFAIVDLTAVYPDQATVLRRGVALLDRSRVLVQDEFQPKQASAPLRWTMMTRAAVQIAQDGRSAQLTSHGRQLRVEILEGEGARLRSTSARPPTADEIQNDGVTQLTIDISPASTKSATRLAVLLTPLDQRWPQLPAPTLQPLVEWH